MASEEFGIARAPLLAPSRQPVSPPRRSEGRLRTFALDLGPSTFAPPRAPGYAQLVTLRSGAALLHCAGARAILMPGHAVWVPEGTAYGLDLHTRCELRVLYAEARDYVAPFAPVLASSLLAELIERAVVAGYLDSSNARQSRLIAVIDDELGDLVVGSAAHSLVWPRDPHLLDAIGRALAECDDVPSIATLAGIACMSARTFERRFRRETALTPREWVRRARFGRAALAVAAGVSVTEAALGCGYASLSAFIAAYRKTFGVTPGSTKRNRGDRRPHGFEQRALERHGSRANPA